MSHRSRIWFNCLCLATLGMACESTGPTIIAAPDTETSAPIEDAATPSVSPELFVTTPARGTWLTRDDLPAGTSIEIQGTMTHPESDSGLATVNELISSIFQGGFTQAITPKEGLNVVSVRVETEDGERAVDGRAVIYGDFNTPAIQLPNAVQVHANPEFLDDNEPDLDDIASIAESILTSPGVLDGILEPIDTSFAVLTPTSVDLSSVTLDILPIEGALRFNAVVQGFELQADIAGKGELDSLLFGKASVASSQLELTIVLSASVIEGVPAVSVDYTDLSLADFTLESEAIDALVEQYPALGAALVEGGTLAGLIEDYVSDTFEDIVSSLFRDLLAGFLESFAYDTEFGEAPRVFVNLTLSTVAVTTAGLDIGLSAAVSAPAAPAVPLDPARSGSLATTEAPAVIPPTDAPVWFLIDDDLLNQFAYAFWSGGVMTGLDLQGDKLSVINPSELPQVFSPLTRLEVDTLLPPTLTARPGDDGSYPFLIGLGDVVLTLHTQTGRRFECSLNAETGFWIDFNDNAAIVPLLDTSPRNMNLAVGCDDVPAGFDPGSVAALLRIGLPPLLRNAAEDFSYPLPELPLGNFIPLESLKDTTLEFSSMNAQVIGEERRTLLIQAFPTLNFTGSAVPKIGNE